MIWPKRPYYWRENGEQCVSIPFTWTLAEVKREIEEDLFGYTWRIGGPATFLMPDYFAGMENVIQSDIAPGILQRIHSQATRTSIGCPGRCRFCGVDRIEPAFKELDDWSDLPVICDNNLLATTSRHFDKVMDRLEKHNWCDFNQGLDVRYLNVHHVQRLARLRGARIRLSLDSMKLAAQWSTAFDLLRAAGCPKARIYVYCLVGFEDSPEADWSRVNWIENHGVKAFPQWFHRLDAQKHNEVTTAQQALGWDDAKQKQIMQWFYQHRGSKLVG